METQTQAVREEGRGSGPRARLEAVGGPMDGEVFVIDRWPCVLGRDRACDLPLPRDTGILARHAVLEFDAGRCWIAGVAGAAVRVDGNDVYASAPLAEGTIFGLGGSEFEFTQAH